MIYYITFIDRKALRFEKQKSCPFCDSNTVSKYIGIISFLDDPTVDRIGIVAHSWICDFCIDSLNKPAVSWVDYSIFDFMINNNNICTIANFKTKDVNMSKPTYKKAYLHIENPSQSRLVTNNKNFNPFCFYHLEYIFPLKESY